MPWINKYVPNVGDTVLYNPREEENKSGLAPEERQMFAALVTYVHEEDSVNLIVFSDVGEAFVKVGVDVVLAMTDCEEGCCCPKE